MVEICSVFVLALTTTFTINVTVLVVNLGLLWSMRSRTRDSCVKLCLPDNGNILCECQSTALENYLEKAYLEESRKRKTWGNIKDKPTSLFMQKLHESMQSTPTAKLVGSRQNAHAERSRGGMTSLLSWTKGNDCHMSNGMTDRNGCLVVPRAGTYYIYGQLEVSSNINDSSGIRVDITKSNIMGGERILFQNFVPNSVFLAPSSGYRDVYIGSAVKLKAQDEIYVRISDASVLRNPSANMIGGYMV